MESAAICIPTKRKNDGKKLARVSNVSLGILSTPLITYDCAHVHFGKGVLTYIRDYIFFLQHHRAVAPLSYNTHFCAQQMLQNYRKAFYSNSRGKVYLHYSYQILNVKEAPRFESMTVDNQTEVILLDTVSRDAKRGHVV